MNAQEVQLILFKKHRLVLAFLCSCMSLQSSSLFTVQQEYFEHSVSLQPQLELILLYFHRRFVFMYQQLVHLVWFDFIEGLVHSIVLDFPIVGSVAVHLV